MVTTDEKVLNAMTREELVEKVKEAELSREEWHTRLSVMLAKHWQLQAKVKEMEELLK